MLTWNAVDMSQYFSVNDIRGRSVYARNLDLISVTGMPGAHLQGVTEPPRPLEIDITIRAENLEKLRQKIDDINGIMVNKEPVPLTFSDEPDKTYYGMTEEITEEIERDTVHKTTINVLCLDPYKYGPERTLELKDISTIENEGTAEAEPIFELTAKEKATFAMISNGTDEDSEYNLIGAPADDDVEVVDTKVSILYENGRTIDTWSPAILDMVDTRFIDNVTDTMTSDDAGIRADGYGTGDKQHGPAVFKELDNPISDFEVESTFDIISRRERENFRMGIFLHDENMNNLGFIGIKDNSRVYKRRTPLARYGPYRGGGKENGYLIGDRHKNDNAREITLFYLRAKREGNKFTFYIGEWQNHRHVRQWEESYIDAANEFAGRLKYVTLFIGKYQDRPNPSRLRINSVEVSELNKVTQDQTPNILYPGDKVIFDHKNEDILVNGEPRNDLKNFGGSFFTLKRGLNNLIVSPPDTFSATVNYRNKYL